MGFGKIELGIAPIGWTNDDMPELGGGNTFEQMLSEAALAGFTGTEVGGRFPANPAVLNKALEMRGLKIILMVPVISEDGMVNWINLEAY